MDYINKVNNNCNVGWGSELTKRLRAAMLTTLADNHALEDEDLQQGSNENEEYDRDEGGGGKMIKKKGRCLTFGGGKGIRDPLNTTASTTNLIMNNKGKTRMMTSSTPREEGEGDDSSFRFNQTGVTGKNVVLFNNRPDKDGEVPSNGDNLGGNDELSNNDIFGRSAGDERDGRGDDGRKTGWEEDYSGGVMARMNLSSTPMMVRRGGERGSRTTMRTTLMRMITIMKSGRAVNRPRGAGWQP